MDMRGGRSASKAPARGWYALGCLPVILGFAAFIGILVAQLPKMDDELKQIVVPGAAELALEPGRHTVFLEYRSVVNGKVYAIDQVPGLSVRVEASDGTPVAVRAPMGSASYSLGGRRGEAIDVFEVDRAGTYRISADYGETAGPETVIAVGQDFMQGMFVVILSAMGVVAVGLLLSAAVIVAIYLARRKARRPT